MDELTASQRKELAGHFVALLAETVETGNDLKPVPHYHLYFSEASIRAEEETLP